MCAFVKSLVTVATLRTLLLVHPEPGETYESWSSRFRRHAAP